MMSFFNVIFHPSSLLTVKSNFLIGALIFSFLAANQSKGGRLCKTPKWKQVFAIFYCVHFELYSYSIDSSFFIAILGSLVLM